ncbi:phage tail tape measure protein [Nocardioides sp.]|uniref:phage tail tape measure protein n=1 Tax=Nocardioides sp. TaxID=35761 RepID=UPI00356631D4
MALSRDIVVRLIGDNDSAMRAQKAFADELGVTVSAVKRAERAYDQQQKAMEVAAQKQQRAMQDVGRVAVGFGATMAAGLGLAVKAAMDWESSWAGVTKTVSGSERELAQLEQGLRGLTRVLPASHQEIAAVAEAAGQLGVEIDSVVEFTRTMVNLGETTNLSAEEAATSLAQLMNVMNTAPEDVGRLGAALVELGNNGASTEADIVKMASYITGSAALIGASESDVLALANTMTSLGINAERGGGVMTRTMQDIYSAVQTGGDQLEGFARTAGMSSAEFARAFEADPIRAIGAFTDGLAAAKDRGENVVGMLADLGIKGTQDTAVLLQMASAQGMVTENLDLGNSAWEQNNALVEEAAKRYDTTAAQLEIARNGIAEAGIEIGEVLLPVLASLAEGVADVAQWFADLPDPVQKVLAALGSVAAVGGLAGGAFLLLAPRVMETYRSFRELSASAPGVASGLGKVGKAAGIAGVVVALGHAIGGLIDSMGDAPATMEETTQALLGMETSMESLDAMFQRGGADLWSEDINGLADAARELTDPSLLNRLDDFGGSVGSLVGLGSADGRPERAALIEQLHGIGDALGLMVDSGSADLAAEQFDHLAAEWKKGGGTVDELMELMPGYQEALDGIANEQELAAQTAQQQAASTALLAQDLNVAYGSLQGYAAALGYSEDQTAELIKASSELGQSLGDFIDPLGAYTGMLDEKAAAEEEAARKAAEAAGAGADSWRDFVVDTGFSFDEYMARLEEQVTAQANWQTNMLILAGRVSEGTLAELSRMGPEGAPLVADLVNRSDAELDRFDDITAMRSREATDAWGAQLTIAAPVLAAIGRTAGAGVVTELARQLAAGTTTVAAIAAQYGVSLAGGINPILTGLGKRPIAGVGGRVGGLIEADGGVVSYYADGGMESHVAQIAPAGAWRVWAEPETGGEAYIPLSPAKRARSLDIWQETGRRLNAFADGGFSSVDKVPRPPSTSPFQFPISTPADALMERAYGDTVDWLKANLAPALGPGIGWQAMMTALRGQFPGLALNSGFRPGSITATGNLSYHASGRAVDVPPRADVFEWIYKNYFGQTKELIYSPAGKRQIWNGKHHMYSEPTRGDHWDHVHWAMAQGGILNPHVRDQGGPLLPGYTYNGTRRQEWVGPMPGVAVGAGRGGAPTAVHVHFDSVVIEGALEVGSDGIAHIVAAEMTDAIVSITDRGRFNS